MKEPRLALSFLAAALIGAMVAPACSGAVTIHVAPDGNDRWSGRPDRPNPARSDGPLATLAGARARLRGMRITVSIEEPVHVVVADGRYTLTEPFVLTPADSGTKKAPIIYEAAPGARPVFSGGKRISGFTKAGEGLWKTHIAEVAAGQWYFEQLFVNGRRATRARTPNKWYHYMGDTSEVPVEGQAGRFRRTTEVRGDALRLLKGLSDAEIHDVLLHAYHKWCISRRYLQQIDAEANTIITVGEKLKSYSGWPANTRFHLENFKAALDAPGEWFLSRDGTLYYKPRPGEDMAKAEVIAPYAPKLVVFEGQPEAGRFVEHVTLKGLTFEHNRYVLPATGYAPFQAAYATDAVVMADGARHVTIADCEELAHQPRHGGQQHHPRRRPHLHLRRRRLDRPERRQHRHPQRNRRLLLYRPVRRLALGLFRQPRQTQQPQLQPRPPHGLGRPQ